MRSMLAEETRRLRQGGAEEPVETDRCPTCGRKALSPRVRTDDFRCSGCKAVFARSDVESHLRGVYDTRLTGLFADFLARSLVGPPAKRDVPIEEASDPGVALGCVAFGTSLVAGYWGRETIGGLWLAIGLGAGVGVVLMAIIARASRRASERVAAERHKEMQRDADEEFALRLADHERWKQQHPDLLHLCDALMVHADGLGGMPEDQAAQARRQGWDEPTRKQVVEASDVLLDAFSPDVFIMLLSIRPADLVTLAANPFFVRLALLARRALDASTLAAAFDARLLAYSFMSGELRDAFAQALEADGTSKEQAAFERLRREIHQWMPPPEGS